MNKLSLLLALSLPLQGSELLTTQERDQVVSELSKQLKAMYVFPERAKKMADSIDKFKNSSEYTNLTAPDQFTKRLNEIIKAHTQDTHLGVQFNPSGFPERMGPRLPSKEELKMDEVRTRLNNAGFQKVERLRGNIGYLKITAFEDLKNSKRPIESAMNFVANTDALIVDLRSHSGGHSETVNYFVSHFFPASPKLKLSEIFDRIENKTFSEMTNPKVGGTRYSKPIYLLVNKMTGSAGEAAPFYLQKLGRGIVLGEPTWGGANMGNFVPLGKRFRAFIPFATAVDGKTWEGTGVIPDIKCDPADAQRQAHILALQKLVKSEKDDAIARALAAALEAVGQMQPH